jgi:hypothetical protein
LCGATGRGTCPLCLFGQAQPPHQKTPNPNTLTLCPEAPCYLDRF